MPEAAHHAVHQLDDALHGVAKQNGWLRALAVVLGIVLIAGICGAVIVTFKLNDLRRNDLETLSEARYRIRLAQATSDLRGCRADEEQDRALSDLLQVVLRQPRRSGMSPEQKAAAANTRAAFRDRVAKARAGRDCESIPALALLGDRDRVKLLSRYAARD